jgi:hypothetical protein
MAKNDKSIKGSPLRLNGCGAASKVHGSPVKFAALQFFELFNWASKAQGAGLNKRLKYRDPISQLRAGVLFFRIQ